MIVGFPEEMGAVALCDLLTGMEVDSALEVGDAGVATRNTRGTENLAETLTSGSSALFVVVRNTKPDLVLERLRPFAGRCKVLQNTMSAENEKRIRALLESEHTRVRRKLRPINSTTK